MLSKYCCRGTVMQKTGISLSRFSVMRLQLTVAMSSAAVPEMRDKSVKTKPFSEMPGPRGLPFVGNLFSLPSQVKDDELLLRTSRMFEKYGPIYKVKFGPFQMVNLSEVNAVEKVHRMEGKYPRRLTVGSWKAWRAEHNLKDGIIIGDGENWRRMRSILDRRMMRPAHVATYTDNFNDVVTDFVDRLRTIRDKKGGGQKVPNMDLELFHWSLETICTVLYEIRLGGISDQRSPMIAKFIDAVQGIFVSTLKVIYLPPAVNRIVFRKAQKLHDDSWNTVFTITQHMVDEKLRQLKAEQAEVDESSEVTAGLLSYLLSTDMPLGEVYANISELMLGAVDTTSNTMQWILYELSRHPTVQQQLHQEVTSVAPLGKVPSYDDLQKMPLLKAVVKEVLRMYPITTVSTRVLNEDLVLCGYHVPKDTLILTQTYCLGRDPKLFTDPDSFIPLRWLRSEGVSPSTNPFAWLPFGYGPRMCIARLAVFSLDVRKLKISQTFELIPDDVVIRPKHRGIMVPEKTVNVTFVDR